MGVSVKTEATLKTVPSGPSRCGRDYPTLGKVLGADTTSLGESPGSGYSHLPQPIIATLRRNLQMSASINESLTLPRLSPQCATRGVQYRFCPVLHRRGSRQTQARPLSCPSIDYIAWLLVNGLCLSLGQQGALPRRAPSSFSPWAALGDRDVDGRRNPGARLNRLNLGRTWNRSSECGRILGLS